MSLKYEPSSEPQVYGVPQTLNTANLVYFMALSEVLLLLNYSQA